ncbi:SpoIIE family protein phosphatase [Streptomyces sp. NPDC002519]
MRLWQRATLRYRSWQASDVLIAVPLGLIAAIVVADVLTPPGVPLGPLLIVAPAITASFASPFLTGVIAVIAVAAMLGVGVGLHILTTESVGAQIVSLVVVSLIVTSFRYLRERHTRELEQVRRVSEAAQRVVLRPLPRRIGPLRVASAYLAAQEQAQIGGDLYAAVRTSAGTRVIIGDVMGKGLTAVGDAALLLGAFREAAHRTAALPELMAYLEHSVCWNLAEPTEPGQEGECFITAAIIDVPDALPHARMVSCGHPPPLLLRDHEVTALRASSPAPPLGLGELTAPTKLVSNWGETTILRSLDQVADLKKTEGGPIIVHGSASLNHGLSDAGLIDRYHLLVCPLLLGAGKRLFSTTDKDTQKLELVEHDVYTNGLQKQVFDVVR